MVADEKNHRCIAGVMWDLKPSEGPAYIRVPITITQLKHLDGMANTLCFTFKHCPICGKKNNLLKKHLTQAYGWPNSSED